MIVSFCDKRTESFADGDHVPAFSGFRRAEERALDRLDAANSLLDLMTPGLRLEKLTGDRGGRFSVRIDGQWRICLFWPSGSVEDEEGATVRLTPTTIVLQGSVNDQTMTLGSVDAAAGTVWFEYVVDQATLLGRRDAALRYYNALANLVADEKLRRKKVSPITKTGTTSLPIDDLLPRQTDWLVAIRAYLAEIGTAVPRIG